MKINKCFHNVKEFTEDYHAKWGKLKFVLYLIIEKVWLYSTQKFCKHTEFLKNNYNKFTLVFLIKNQQLVWAINQ